MHYAEKRYATLFEFSAVFPRIFSFLIAPSYCFFRTLLVFPVTDSKNIWYHLNRNQLSYKYY